MSPWKTSAALCVLGLALCQLGCPDSGPTQAERNARLAKARKAMEEADEAEAKAEAERLAALGTWPPLRGKPFPDMVLFDLEGKEVKLSSFKGKVILLQWVATTSPGSIAQAGGLKAEAFQGTPSQQGVWRLDRELKESGVPVDSEDFVWLQVMVYGPREGVPTQSDAKAWAEHFKLAERPRTEVLYADARYQVEATHAMVPGYFVIDPDFTFAFDRANMFSADGYTEVARGLKRLLRLRSVLPAYSPTISPRRKRVEALGRLLKEGKFKELDAKISELLEQGYREDEPGRTHLEAVEGLHAVEGVREEHFAAWIKASPESFVPAYFKGMAHVRWGWAARGDGVASTVTEEGWNTFGSELQKAKEEFTLANRISSSQAYGYTGLLIVARALNAPDKVHEAYFSAAIQADPDYLAAYEMRLTALYPKWGGSVKGALDFVYGSVEARPDYLPLQLLILRLHNEFSRTVFRDGARYLSQKEVATDCGNAAKKLREAYPKSRIASKVAFKIAKRRQVDVVVAAKRLAELGDPYGMAQYGYILKYGQYGTKVDLDKAHEYLVAAGNAGDCVGAGQVAHSLLYHESYKHDPARAFPWLKVSAEGDYGWAMGILADSYFLGRGTKRDLPKAAIWYRKDRTPYAWSQLGKVLAEAPELRLPGDPE